MSFDRSLTASLVIWVACIGPAAAQGSDDFADRLDRVSSIRGVAYSPSYPGIADPTLIPIEIYRQDLRRIRRAGFDTLRTYDALPDAVMEIAHAEGLSVIEGVLRLDDRIDYGSDAVVDDLVDRAVQQVRSRKHHPHILYWCLWNDSPYHWGHSGGNVVRRYGRARMEEVYGRIASAVRREDPDRPLTAAHTLNAPGYDVGLRQVDIIGINVYIGITDWTSGVFDPARMGPVIDRLRQLSRDLKRPVYVSETGYSSYMPADSQSAVIPAQIAALRRAGLGWVLFQWQDEWSKGGNADVQSADIETHWGIVEASRRLKRGYGRILRAVAGARPAGWALRPAEREPSTIVPEARPSIVLEDFEYRDTESLTRAYWERAGGRVRYATRLDNDPSSGSGRALRVIWTARESGAWCHFERRWERPVDLSGVRQLIWRAKSARGDLNVSVMLIDADGERYRGPAVIVPDDGEWRTYAALLDELFLDRYGREVGAGRAKGSGQLDVDRITGVAIKLNDIPNYEHSGRRIEISIDEIGGA